MMRSAVKHIAANDSSQVLMLRAHPTTTFKKGLTRVSSHREPA